LTGESDDFDRLIKGKGHKTLKLDSDIEATDLYLRLVKKKKGKEKIIDMADLKFKDYGKDDDDMWKWLKVKWNGKNKGKTKIIALRGTDISTSPMIHTPIPGAFCLLGTGLVGLAGFRRVKVINKYYSSKSS